MRNSTKRLRVSTEHCASHRAFILIELLVVIGVIAILAALLLPALSKAKSQARRIACGSQLHQYGLALSMYVNDNGKYPRVYIFDESRIGPSQTNYVTWKETLNKLITSNPAWGGMNCTEPNPRPDPGQFLPFSTWSTVGYYGYNGYGTIPPPFTNYYVLGLGSPFDTRNSPPFQGPEIAPSRVQVPSDMIAIGDTMNDYWMTTDYPVNDVLPSGRHNGGANMVFCDNHVEFAKQNAWIEGTDDSLRRWNTDHQPHPPPDKFH